MVAEEIGHWLERDRLPHRRHARPAGADRGRRSRHGPLEHVVVTSLAPRLATWKGWLYRVERLRRHGPFRLRDDGPRPSLRPPAPHRRRGPLPARISPERRRRRAGADRRHHGVAQGGDADAPQPGRQRLQIQAWSRAGDAPDGVLGVLPFFHAYGLSVGLLSSLVGGGRCTCCRSSRPGGARSDRALPHRDGAGGAGDADGASTARCGNGRATCRSSAP